jgi:peptidyl-prolyl cis-trans isomerase B (cyclophilin B)
MKRLSTILILILLTISGLSACGSSTKENKEANSSKQEKVVAKNKEESKSATTKGETNMTYPQLSTEVAENERLVEMHTNKGIIKIKLFPEQAPKTVENFISHSEKGYYDGLIFHRVIKGFMIQGGDPTGTGMGGESIYGETFEDEFSKQLFNLRGALSMANAGPNTNGSQFFIVQSNTLDDSMKTQLSQAGYAKEVVDAYAKGGTPWLDGRHTVFGQVIEGMDVVDAIANSKVGKNDKPVEDVIIEKVVVVK